MVMGMMTKMVTDTMDSHWQSPWGPACEQSYGEESSTTRCKIHALVYICKKFSCTIDIIIHLNCMDRLALHGSVPEKFLQHTLNCIDGVAYCHMTLQETFCF